MVAVCALAALGTIQIASDALFAGAAAPGTLPKHIPMPFGLSVYRFLDRIAPAEYVEDTLGNAALARGDIAAAQRHAVRMPPNARRNDLLGRIALARGQTLLAQEYFFVAPDVEAMQHQISLLLRSDPRSGYALEKRFVARLQSLGTHPDAVADGYWREGVLAASLHESRTSLRAYQRAVRLAPLNMTYILAAANQAYVMHDDAVAEPLYRQGLSVNPRSADVVAGLGIMALHRGDRAAALRYAARARALDPRSGMLRDLIDELR